ncbi:MULTISPECIES: ATP-binding protein [unclassified Paenibacillus]|uniref:two-component system histidine kinase PnpS n=1 Tax=unclassified Paenibacillus TaxID=185978 RepID=UPI002404B0F0|nr:MULTISPECIES: ATP-binding protein [unclassified Paenibacillus]MDF9845222.1 two-component system phosphate regulon sensor histidine kinase PhoR [Paenibacillus sp. PastF-2]MDF9851797.1 two-component system phosphate regulon sensor histidine kinase PhoR [Paenibacillus sp. PastM-2]MDF9858388.1 two-component system phosphate regulon sensor histidine kinase PhoR [Paenibacillus sp. PastF-1]MDH6483677.1 two-component system phosphate regulon sensor histidine kinase PhoR [Paenibacillus sp. PastH-2]M
MKPFRIRLTFILMALVGISMIGAGLTMAKLFKDSHISALEENMSREIKLLSGTFQFIDMNSPQAISYYTEHAEHIAGLTDSRITFITKEGKVIGDSERNPLEMDNHLGREEEVLAAKEGIGRAIRYSNTLDREMLYVAGAVTSDDGFDGYIRLSMGLDAVTEGLSRAWIIMAAGLVLLFVAATFVSYKVASSMTSPLEQITRVARRITDLDYDARVPIQRKDEVGQLAKAINAMADSLQAQLKTIRDNEDLLQSVLDNMTGGIVMVNAEGEFALINRAAERMLDVKNSELAGHSYKELKHHYELSRLIEEGVLSCEPIHEERSIYTPAERIVRLDGVPMTQDSSHRGMLFLLQEVTEIRRLEKMRSEFVANVSHELKTPVAAVKGFAETLLGGGVSDEKTARSFLQIIYDENERLNRLIGDILELSKIESKRVQLDCSPVYLSEFFDSVLETLSKVAEKKKITLNAIVPDELFMEGDEDKLRQIFMNLLSNAINYTHDGGNVKITVVNGHKPDGTETVIFTVSDTGMGIPRKDLPRIFERFYRVDKARSRSSGGTGLGLSIVKHLVELHRGTITVESDLGIGSSFILELPLLQEHDK